VGFVGYPNVGKSSVINTLKSGKVCKVAPIPGETKVWQYITLTKRIYLVDCPGVVPSSANDSLTSTVLKGVVRVEALPTPSDHVPTLMKRVKPLYLSRTYGVPLPNENDPSETWEPEDFLDKLARMKGRLLKGGEPDIEGVARIILSDWVRGRIPFFVPPPERSEELNQKEEEKRKKEKAKAKAKEFVPGVTQKLGGIIQKNTFVGEDVRPVEETQLLGSEDGNEWTGFDDDDEEQEDGDIAEEHDGSEAEISWGDVFTEDKSDEVDLTVVDDEESDDDAQEALSENADEGDNNVDDFDEDSLDKRKHRPKEPRMTTNKVSSFVPAANVLTSRHLRQRKATNFFDSANVKNKNRNRAKGKPVTDKERKQKVSRRK
jgi:nuclear GTP-binding protein